MALDFVKSRAAIEEELDLVLAEVHLRNIPPGSLANSELLHHILNELQVPLITMCAYDDEEAISELVALRACSHVMKPLHTGSLNVLKKIASEHKSKKAIALEHKSKKAIALEHKSKKETPQGPIPSRTKSRRVSSSTKGPVPKVRKAYRCSKKTGRITWTIELHEMFLDAIEVLGDKHATPEEIRKLMNVKGLTSKHISSHLQKHRLLQQNAKQGAQHKKYASMKPVSELIGSAPSAAATESTPTVDADSREVYPSRLWTQVKEAALLRTCSYRSASRIYRNRRWREIGGSSNKDQSPAKNNVVLDGGVSSESPKGAGEIGYCAFIESPGSSSLSTSLVDQIGENNRTEAAGKNGYVENINLPEDTMNKEHTATTDPSDIWAFLQSNNLDLIGPSEDRNEEISDWSELERLLDQQNLGLEDPLQVDNAWNNGLAPPSLINIDGSMVQEGTVQNAPQEGTVQNAPQEATIQNAPVYNPVMPIAQDDGFLQDQQNLGPEDLLQVDNAWNTGLELPSLINMDGSMAQEATVQNAPVHNPVMPIAQDDIFWSWSPPVGDFDMLL
ncbi:unnamed protein product [Urochloa decumbens]|uniref:Uncharacterized protein n=1 Tax=Urochloa decumbens TaxID=240449 RepID=A0ABC9E358_9POAL